mmetsp:Transcript_98076/g.316250  ORF Transcript_98076/g.316250 Transcript_98076/m.316250 type:complete len:169 (-) Transcript_98076:226-732(-)
MLCCGATSGLFGLLLPWLLRACPKRTIWVGALSIGALAMCLMANLQHPVPVAFALVALLGVALGARESIPWSVITAVSKGTPNAGANTSVFNLSQAVPGLIGACMGSAVLRVTTLSAIFAACAVPMALAVAAVLALLPADLEAAEEAAARSQLQAGGQGQGCSKAETP